MLAQLLTTVAFAVADLSAGSAPALKAPAPVAAPREPVVVAVAALPEKPVAAGKPVFETMSDAAVADEALAYLEGLSTLSGAFVQTAPSGGVARGKFYLRRPGQIRFDYDDPSPITIVATGGLVYVENSEIETTDSYPLKKTPLRFLLSKKIDIGDAVLTSVDRRPDSVALTYASTDAETEGEITLVLAAPILAIREWAVTDAQDGVTVVALEDVESGGKLDNRLFRAPDSGGAFINK
jgi:outer membrane lipoprotein-sorting protein